MNKMRTIFLLLVTAAIFQSTSAQIRKVKLNELQHLIDTSSTPMVINFWATWCGPCIREIPWFEKNIAKFADQKVKLILVSLDYPSEYPKEIAAFAKQHNYKAEIIWLNEPYAEEYCPKIDKSWQGTIPVTLMVNNKKNYRMFYNQQLPEPKLVQELKKLTQ